MAGNLPSLFDDDMFFSDPGETKKPASKKKQASTSAASKAVTPPPEKHGPESPESPEGPDGPGRTQAASAAPAFQKEAAPEAAGPGPQARPPGSGNTTHAASVKPSLELPPDRPAPTRDYHPVLQHPSDASLPATTASPALPAQEGDPEHRTNAQPAETAAKQESAAPEATAAQQESTAESTARQARPAQQESAAQQEPAQEETTATPLNRQQEPEQQRDPRPTAPDDAVPEATAAQQESTARQARPAQQESAVEQESAQEESAATPLNRQQEPAQEESAANHPAPGRKPPAFSLGTVEVIGPKRPGPEGHSGMNKNSTGKPANATEDGDDPAGRTAPGLEDHIGLPEWQLDKNYYTIGEVAGFFKVNISHIRFWTKEFKLKPRTTRKGDRLYTPEQIGRLRLIHHLVKEKKHTLQGAKERLQSGPEKVSHKLQLKDALTALRATLVELRKELG